MCMIYCTCDSLTSLSISKLADATRPRTRLRASMHNQTVNTTLANGSYATSGSESSPSAQPQPPPVPNFRVYETPGLEGQSAIYAQYTSRLSVDPGSRGQAVNPNSAPSYITVEDRLRNLEVWSARADGVTRKLLDDAQKSILDIRNKLSNLNGGLYDLREETDENVRQIAGLNDKLDLSSVALETIKERVDNLFAESAHQLTETLLTPIATAVRELLGGMAGTVPEGCPDTRRAPGARVSHVPDHVMANERDVRLAPTDDHSTNRAIDQTNAQGWRAPTTGANAQDNTEHRLQRPRRRANQAQISNRKQPWQGRLRSR